MNRIFESFSSAFVLLALFAGLGTPIYLLIVGDWKIALILFIAYIIAYMLMGFGAVLTKLKQIDILYFIYSIIFLIISIIPHAILTIGVCVFLWGSYEGIFMGILCVSNICYGILIAISSFAIVIWTRDDIKQKQAELAEAKKKEQQEIIETAVKNALKEYKNMEK